MWVLIFFFWPFLYAFDGLSMNSQVGYIVMVDPSTGVRTNLLRMKGARVVAVYHPLIDDRLVKILHGYETHSELWIGLLV